MHLSLVVEFRHSGNEPLQSSILAKYSAYACEQKQTLVLLAWIPQNSALN